MFDSQWCHWNLSLLQSFRPLSVPGIDTGRYNTWRAKEDRAYGQLSGNLGDSSCWNPQVVFRPVQGFINIFIVVWITRHHGTKCRYWNVWSQNLVWEWGQGNISSCFPLMIYNGTQKIHNDNSKSCLLVSYLEIWDKPRNNFCILFPLDCAVSTVTSLWGGSHRNLSSTAGSDKMFLSSSEPMMALKTTG